jgi:hypothetical protein
MKLDYDMYRLNEGDRILMCSNPAKPKPGRFIKYMNPNKLHHPQRAVVHLDGNKNPSTEWLHHLLEMPNE